MTVFFTHLTTRYRAVTAVDDQSVEVQPSRFTTFLGPNGSGKTTSMRALLGLTQSSGLRPTPFPANLFPEVAKWLPTGAALGLTLPANPGQDVLSPGLALLVLLGWTALIAVVATAVSARREVR